MSKRIRAALAACMILSSPIAAHAIGDPAEALADPRQEARAVEVGRQLRCLVCQNESIEDSGADLARDLRHIVRERVAAGEPDQAIIDWMVARYGNFVRLRPPFEPLTVLLWGSPVLALAIGGGAVWAARRRPGAAPVPLSELEQARLAELLRE